MAMSVQEENRLLNMIIESQAARLAEQEATIKELRATIDELRTLKANLEETLNEFKRQFFGIRSEKTSHASKEETAGDAQAAAVTVKEHARERRPKATREELYKDLPVREIICPVPENERFCEWCNSPMMPMKPVFVREEIRITTAKVERVRYMQEVYICPECRRDDNGVFKKGTVPVALIPHSPASASSVAHVVFDRFFLSLPYNRMEAEFRQLGVKIRRATLASWCITSAKEFFLPVYERLHREIVKRDIVHADETTCQVLHEEGKDATSTSYMWLYTSGTDGLPGIVLYDYRSGRSGSYPQQFLEGFHGMLQCDGYQGYNSVQDVLLVCCSAHARRKFYEALPAERKKKIKLLDINSDEAIKEPDIPETELDRYIPAEIGVAYFNRLFYIERQLKGLAPEERREKRVAQALPVWDRFFAWAEGLNPTGGSKLDKAVRYALNHKDGLQSYLKDGRCELSNNVAERRAKSYAIGRKNSLFHASVDGATASAIIYSLVETAKANSLNVFQYIYTLLIYMPGYKDGSAGIEQLMPWSDFIKEHCSGAMDIEKMTVEEHPELIFN